MIDYSNSTFWICKHLLVSPFQHLFVDIWLEKIVRIQQVNFFKCLSLLLVFCLSTAVTYVPVKNNRNMQQTKKVYNFSTPNFHFIRAGQILVHAMTLPNSIHSSRRKFLFTFLSNLHTKSMLYHVSGKYRHAL